MKRCSRGDGRGFARDAGSACAAALCLVAAATTAERLKFPCAGEVVADRANVRAGRSLNYEIVATLERGERVTVTGLEGGWFGIVPPADVPLWVASRYVADGAVICGRLNVRAKPALKANVVGALSRGDRVEVVEEGVDWTRIRAPSSAACWVSAELIELHPRETAPGKPAAAGEEERPGPPASPPAERRPPPRVFEGTIRKADEAGVPGVRHRLVAGTLFRRTACLIVSETINIAYFEGDRVRVWGYEVARSPAGTPIVDVRRLEVE
ncbi:MAG: SH3 domain-containing protein [bacterium]|nr:SH3 domain-containing protein [bacterium]